MKLVREEVSDFLSPKSEKELKDAMKDLNRDDYGELVGDEITRILEENFLDYYIEFSGADEAFKNMIPPPTFAKQVVEKYFKENWKPDGGMGLTNTGGIEIKLIPSGDGVEYRYTGETIPYGTEIEYDYGNQEVGREDEDDEVGGAYFETAHGNKYWLGDFMRY